MAVAGIVLLLSGGSVHGASVTPQETVELSSSSCEQMLSVRAGLGYLTGEASEYVYDETSSGRTVSELSWDIDSLLMFGLGGTIVPINRLKINGDIWFNVTDGDGYMSDSDWVVPGVSWTNQSLHDDTDVTTGFMLDLNVEVEALAGGQMSFTGLAGYRVDRFEWEARGGSYVYSIDGFRDTSGRFPSGLLGITYEQTYYVPYFGVGFSGVFDRIRLSAKLMGSFLVSGEANDTHHLRNLETEDDFSGGNMWAIDATFAYDLTDSLGMEVAGFYEKYDTMKGDSTWKYNNSGITINHSDNAGADLAVGMISTSLTLSF